ncbi:MAG: glycosyltransferase family 39 protein [Chloroflexota bacterium]
MSTLAELEAPPASNPPRLRPSPGLATWLALALILGVGAFTHLSRLDLVEFKSDEAQVATLALSAAQGHWPAASIATSNGGLDNPPLPLYLFALPALFTRDPAWQAAVSALLDLTAMLLTFLTGKRYFNDRAALAAAAFYASAAYPAMFARKLAGPYLQPFFAALLLWAVLAIAGRSPRPPQQEREPSRWLWAGAILALGALIQIHLGALLLAPVLAVLLVLDMRRRRSWRPLLPAVIGAVGVAALFAPYLAYEVTHRAGFFTMVGSYVQGTPGWTLEAFHFVWTTISSPGYGDLTGASSGMFNAETWPALYVALLGGVAAVGGLAVAIWHWRDRRYLSLATFVLLPLLLTLHHGPGLQIHYFAFLLPALFLLAGIGFAALLRAMPGLRLPGFAVLGLVLAVQVAGFRHFTEFLERQALPDSYGLPLAYQERLFDQASRLAAGRRIVAGVASRDQEEPARYLLSGLPVVMSDANEGLLLPADGGVYVALNRGAVSAHALESAIEPTYTERLPGGTAEAAAYTLPPDSLHAIAQGIGAMPAPAAAWANRLRLLGVVSPRSLPAQLASAWQVTAPVDASTLFFSQLVDDEGKQWFDRDAAPAPASEWRPGDGLLLLTPAVLPDGAPRQEYWWSIGMYVEGGRRVALVGNGTELRLARLKGGSQPVGAPALSPASTVFGGAIRLQGYAIQPGSVTLQWTSLAAVDRDYTVFVHALDASGKVVAQADAQPSHYPTSLWDLGETILDAHALDVPPGASVEVGLYDLATGQRLKLPNGADHLTLP